MSTLFIPFLLLHSLSISMTCVGVDMITTTQYLRYGETIVSKNGTFVMGFFTPANSINHYVGTWYNQIPVQTVVWVANRDNPIANTSSAVLKITQGGQLALVGGNAQEIWSVNMSRMVQNPVAELLDSGNLVLREADDENPENFLWQSFDYPTDHYLPGMKLGWNLVSGHEVYVTAREHEEAPASGEYTFHVDLTGYPQAVIKNRETEVYGSGPWNGLHFSGTPSASMNTNPRGLVMNKKEVYIWYSQDLGLLRFVLTSNGVLKAWGWDPQKKEWQSFLSVPSDNCDTYSLCGANSICNIGNYPTCGCLNKFLPNNAVGNVSRGCHRKTPLNCHNGSSSDSFLKYSAVKLPDTKHSWYNKSSITLQECKETCLKNCSCMAYSTLNINRGSGCLFWSGDLVEIRWLDGSKQDIYIRLASLDVPAGGTTISMHSGSKRKKVEIIALCLSSLLALVFLACCFSLWYFCKKRIAKRKLEKEFELPLYDVSTIARATNNFSSQNKLGEGGFGTVYKGALDGGQDIAVKRLSKTSQQGLEEFKNEVICVAKLQHRNLVKLQGCCISGEEKMLIYEYMPNKSLDIFIFDQKKKKLLNWNKRINIIVGIARGLLYLHRDSRQRIIHRDLKASNVLLDLELNPKISDFGLAKNVGVDETADRTKRIAGTHGYISPEYAAHGIFSLKSDVFSFGVLVLEIVSGRKNNYVFDADQDETLLGHALKLNMEGRAIELVDENIAESCDVAQVIRAIHVGLLCVQQRPEDRPNMSGAVKMLVNDAAVVNLPQPKEPAFFTGSVPAAAVKAELSPANHSTVSMNEVTITSLTPR